MATIRSGVFFWLCALVALPATGQQMMQPPVVFEPNRGQAAPEALFLGRSGENLLFFTERAVVFALPAGTEDEPTAELVTMFFGGDGGEVPAPIAEDRAPGVSHHFHGNDPEKWFRHVPHYRVVRYPEIYKGIDLVFRAKGSLVEYDFELAPGADPSEIDLQFSGAETRTDPETGDLLVLTPNNVMRHRKPAVFQRLGSGENGQEPLDGEFLISEGRGVGFAVGEYAAELDLLIDPVIEFFRAYDEGVFTFRSEPDHSMTLTEQDGILLAGATRSYNLPIRGALQQFRSEYSGFTQSGLEGYILKFAADGQQLMFGTYLGGTGTDMIQSIAVSADGIVFGGRTASDNFPTWSALYDRFAAQSRTSFGDGFVGQIVPDGSAFVFATYFGGPGDDSVTFATPVANGEIYFGGCSDGQVPMENAIQREEPAGTNGFAARLLPTGVGLTSSIYVGSDGEDCLVDGLATEDGQFFAAGWTDSSQMTNTAGMLQEANAGNLDGFLVKLLANGSGVERATFLGGSADDRAAAMALDADGNLLVTGSTESADFPLRNAADSSFGGSSDVFAARIRSSFGDLLFSTFWGGSSFDAGHAIVEDGAGAIHVAAESKSSDWTRHNPLQGDRISADWPLFRSADGGQTWMAVRGGLPYAGVASVVGDPFDSQRIFLRPTNGPFVASTDGGSTWSDEDVGPPSVSGYLIADTAIPGKYFGVSASRTPLYVTEDYGNSWTEHDEFSRFTSRDRLVHGAASAVRPGRLYILFDTGFARSDDSGVSFTRMAGPNSSSLSDRIIPSPVDPDQVFVVATHGVFRSDDAGKTWTGDLRPVGVGGCRSLAALGDAPFELYLACFTSVFRSLDLGETWTLRSIAPVNIFSEGLAVDPLDRTHLFAATFAGLLESTDGGASWLYNDLGIDRVGWVRAVGTHLYAQVSTPPDIGLLSLSSDGSSPTLSTLLGGLGEDRPTTLVRDSSGKPVLSGTTRGGIAPTPATDPRDPTTGPFVLRWNTTTPPCDLQVHPPLIVPFSAIGGISVTAPSGCPWQPIATAPWINVRSSGPRSGSGAVSLFFEPNTGATRTGSVTVGDKSVVVSQLGTDCTYSLSAAPTAFASGGGSGTISIATEPGCPWVLHTDAHPRWAQFTETTGHGPSTLGVTLEPHTGAAERQAYIQAGGESLRLTQAGLGFCSVGLEPNSISADAAGGEYEFRVNTPLGCGSLVDVPVDWIEINAGSRSTAGGATYWLQVLPSEGPARETAIAFGGTSLRVTQTAGVRRFADVVENAFFAQAVTLFGRLGITDGCAVNPLRFCPDGLVTRGQMAVFLIRAIFGGDDFEFPAEPLFDDVPPDHPFYKWIQKMGEMGITSGCAARRYCPSAFVTRGQMAVFMLRVRFGASYAPTAFSNSPFGDVAVDHPFRDWIRQLREEKITDGCAANAFCPENPVTRGQMAIFVMRAAFNRLMPAWHPRILSISAGSGRRGETVDFTLEFVGFSLSALDFGPGITVESLTLAGTNEARGQLRIAADAVPGPRTISSGGPAPAVLPNGFFVLE